MSQPKVLALLAKRKFRETMGPINPQPEVFDKAEQPAWALLKPRYQVGDMLYVKETYVIENTIEYEAYCNTHIPTDRPVKTIETDEDGTYHLIPHYRATEREPNITDHEDGITRWTASVFMPKWAARIWMPCTKVTVQWKANLLHFVYWWDEIIIKGETQRQFEKNISAGVS